MKTKPLQVTKEVHFRHGRGSRKVMKEGKEPEKPGPLRVPRIARLMALAIRMDQMVESGEVADYADLARLFMVSRARITQIMNLRLLAPDIQEALLYLPMTDGRRAPIREKHIRPIAAIPDWRKQRKLWQNLII